MASRRCKHPADAFCYVCGQFIKTRVKQYFVEASAKMCEAYKSVQSASYSTKVKKRKKIPAKDKVAMPSVREINNETESLATRGYLRAQKPYEPPPEAHKKVQEIFNRFFTQGSDAAKLEDHKMKFQFLSSCAKEFKHSVPNSQLHMMSTLQEVMEFYQTPVKTTVPLDAMKDMELPRNLHIQYDSHRFHPETDTLFGGISAYPQSSTIVTGLRYKKKYRAFKAKTSWP